MDAPTYHETATDQVIRDKRGIVIGRLEEQRLTGKTLARDARGLLIGQYDNRANLTRDARGVLVGSGNLLPALLLR